MFVLLPVMVFALQFFSSPVAPPANIPAHYNKPYVFTEDWFTGNIDNWRATLREYRGKPNLKYLEIGAFEGRSALWVLEHILTHRSSRLTLVDPDTGAASQILKANLDRSGRRSQIFHYQSPSQIVMRDLPMESYDIIYIDGSHDAWNVYLDAALAWTLLKPGGTLIFDDYPWKKEDGFPPKRRPQVSIDAFLVAFEDQIEVLEKEWQVIVRKRSPTDKPVATTARLSRARP